MQLTLGHNAPSSSNMQQAAASLSLLLLQVPRFVQRLRIVELTLDHEAPYFSNMRRRNSRKDSDLNGVVDLRYTGGARMLLVLELGEGRWRFKVGTSSCSSCSPCCCCRLGNG